MFGSTLVIVTAIGLLHETVTRGGLYPIGTGAFRDFTQLTLEVVAAETSASLAEVIVLEDHLHFRATAVRFIADSFDIALHVGPIAAERFANIQDHVDFNSSVLACQFGLVAFRIRVAASVRKTDDRPEADAGALERSEERRVGKECRSRWSPY